MPKKVKCYIYNKIFFSKKWQIWKKITKNSKIEYKDKQTKNIKYKNA